MNFTLSINNFVTHILLRDRFGERESIFSALFSYECFAGPGETFLFEISSAKHTRLSLPRAILPRGELLNVNEARVLYEFGDGLSSFSFSNLSPFG